MGMSCSYDPAFQQPPAGRGQRGSDSAEEWPLTIGDTCQDHNGIRGRGLHCSQTGRRSRDGAGFTLAPC